MKEKRLKGDLSARMKIKEKNEKQREVQKRYRQKVKERKAAAAAFAAIPSIDESNVATCHHSCCYASFYSCH